MQCKSQIHAQPPSSPTSIPLTLYRGKTLTGTKGIPKMTKLQKLRKNLHEKWNYDEQEKAELYVPINCN